MSAFREIRLTVEAWLKAKRPWGAVIALGITLVAFGTGPMWFNGGKFQSGSTFIELNAQQLVGKLDIINCVVVVAGLAFLVAGVSWCFIDWQSTQRCNQRKKTIAIEVRGLRNELGVPLAKALPRSFSGNIQELLVDLRELLIDGRITSPATGIKKINGLLGQLNVLKSGSVRGEVEVIVGGLASVPFLFLIGVLLDDESNMTFMDWDRYQKRWRELSEDDDGENFKISGMDTVSPSNVCVMLSTSYRIDKAAVSSQFPDLPKIEVVLPSLSISNHWSRAKQERLCIEFHRLIKTLSDLGVQEIQLFLACPSSLALRFGTCYDRRLLPRVFVHQFERGQEFQFPWSIEMPVAGIAEPSVVTFA